MSDLYGQIKMSVDTNIESEGKSFNFFPVPMENGVIVDVVENNVLDVAEVAVTKDGAKYLKLTFKNTVANSTLTYSEFAIDADKTAPDKLKSKLENQLKRIKHITSKYYGQDNYPSVKTFEALVGGITSFEDFIEKLVKILNVSVIKKTPIRLKCVYNYKNFVSLPSYVPFIELQSVSKEESKLRIDPSFDKVAKDVVATDSNADLASLGAQPSSTDDLPF